MNRWLADYLAKQKAAHDSIALDQVERLIEKLRQALNEDRQIFVFGNGGAISSCSRLRLRVS